MAKPRRDGAGYTYTIGTGGRGRRVAAGLHGELLADHLFEEMLSIADNITLDPNSKDNRVLVDKAKLQIETRKYLCGRLNPLRYHEQQGIALNVNLNKKLDEMSDQELIELRNRYLALPAPPKLIEAPRNE